MTKQMAAELARGDQVAAAFVVRDKSLATFRNKPGNYLNLQLGDASGEIAVRVWDNAEALYAALEVGAIVLAEGVVEEWQGRLQLNARVLRPPGEEPVPLELLCPHSARDRGEMLAELSAAMAEVGDHHLRSLLGLMLGPGPLLDRFSISPGAKALHHAYVGGLLEHTLNVVRLCRLTAETYPALDRDLLLTAAVLHDLGKCYELEGETAFAYSDIGRLVGHVVITDRLITEHIAKVPGLPLRRAELLTHVVLSHHGTRDWGAPVVPVVAEACALHHADNLDARVQGFLRERAEAQAESAQWSRYIQRLGTTIYLGPMAAPDDDTQAARAPVENP